MNTLRTTLLSAALAASAGMLLAQTAPSGSALFPAEPPAATAPAAPPSNTVFASRTVHVTQEEGRPDLNEAWMFLQKRAAQLGRELLGIDNENVADWCQIEPVVGAGGMDFRLMLLDSRKPAAKE